MSSITSSDSQTIGSALDHFRQRLSALAAADERAGRALDFVASAAQASGRQPALSRALETADILLGIEADMDTIAAALIVGAIPRNEIDTAIIGEAFGADVAAA